ncbi:MAG: 16S rRNA (guanine(527)-N(7))-methyltransferase RsmG, partial [Candidatus Binatia bacterium]
NLISAASRQEIVDRHLLDSLAVLPLLGSARALADFGSGAGFPGLPLAVVKPDTDVHLIESRRRRANFLRHTVRTLELRNAFVHEMRAEKWRPEVGIEAALGRGIRVEALAKLARGVLAPSGALLVMSKVGQHREIAGFVRDRALSYTLPGGERHEVSRYQRLDR